MRSLMLMFAMVVLVGVACGPASLGSPQSKPLERAPREHFPDRSAWPPTAFEELRATVWAQNGFVADFYRQLAQEADGNLFYSPYSLYLAMGVVYGGARDNTAAEFQEVMGIQKPSAQFHRSLNFLDQTLLEDSLRPGETGSEEQESPPILSVANGLWIQDGLEVLPGFVNTVTTNYGIGLEQLDFQESPDQAVKTINRWVEEATQEKIREIISLDSITGFTSLVVTNAVYFKGKWEYPFEEERTVDGPFYLLGGKVVDVPVMHQSEDYPYWQGDGYQAVWLPYSGEGFDLMVVMPDDGTFEAFEESLTGERLEAMVDNQMWGKVILAMPRFKLEYEFSAKEKLQALGLKDAFDRQRADFTNIAVELGGVPIEALWIEDAVQKALVEVNEEGTEAVAATTLSMATEYSIPPPPVYITIDGPFIFLLRHSDTGAILFMGRVLNPDPEAPSRVGSRPPATSNVNCPTNEGCDLSDPASVPVPTPVPTLLEEISMGRSIFITGAGEGAAIPCVTCHTIGGIPEAVGLLGPDLTYIGTEAAARRRGMSAEEYIEESITEPEDFISEGVERAVPGLMLNAHTAGLTRADVNALVQFLLDQKSDK